jgi:uncharacterized Zn finger protein
MAMLFFIATVQGISRSLYFAYCSLILKTIKLYNSLISPLEYAMPSIPRLTISAVRRWTDDVYFQRGESYYAGGAIYEQRRQGMMIKSKCFGSQSPFYRQEVLFNSKGIESAQCSCPVGAGGHCKHAVALLLTWVNEPDSFQEVEAFDVVLEKRSKPELIALIKQMLEQEPDLESLLDLPLSAEDGTPMDMKAIRRQAQQAFRGMDYERGGYGYTGEIEHFLQPLLNLASDYLTRGNAENAAVIYATVIETIFDNDEIAMEDEEGGLLGLVNDCAESLRDCLSKINVPKKRREILETLFSAYKWDLKAGGVGAADSVPEILTGKTTPEERGEIAKWVRDIMPKGKEWSDDYRRKTLGGFLLDLEADTLDDEAYLKTCRQTGRLNDLIERLLKLKRIEDAADAARGAEDYPLLNTLEIFTKHRQAGLAEKLVTERLEKIKDTRLLEWLSERLKERGDWAGSLQLEERLFWPHPNLEQYKKLYKPARQLDQWNELHTRVIAELEKKKDFNLLVQIHLHNKEVGLAITTLGRMSDQWMSRSLGVEVAKAARAQYPQESIRLYVEAAARIMDSRDRGNYSQAAQYLRETRDTYRQMNDTQSWDKLIANIRERYKKLPALQSELNRLKL